MLLALLLEEEDAFEDEATLLPSEESLAGEVMLSFLSFPRAERVWSGAAKLPGWFSNARLGFWARNQAEI